MQLYYYLKNKSILHKQQYGFRAKKSTTQAIPHFLQYLWCMGIALDWFRSNLTNREQYVCINNVDSNPRVIQCE